MDARASSPKCALEEKAPMYLPGMFVFPGFLDEVVSDIASLEGAVHALCKNKPSRAHGAFWSEVEACLRSQSLPKPVDALATAVTAFLDARKWNLDTTYDHPPCTNACEEVYSNDKSYDNSHGNSNKCIHVHHSEKGYNNNSYNNCTSSSNSSSDHNSSNTTTTTIDDDNNNNYSNSNSSSNSSSSRINSDSNISNTPADQESVRKNDHFRSFLFDQCDTVSISPGQGIHNSTHSRLAFAPVTVVISICGVTPWTFTKTTQAVDVTTSLELPDVSSFYLPPKSLCLLTGPALCAFERGISFDTRDISESGKGKKRKRTKYVAVVLRQWLPSATICIETESSMGHDSSKLLSRFLTTKNGNGGMSRSREDEIKERRKKDKSFIYNRALLESTAVMEKVARSDGDETQSKELGVDEEKAQELEKVHVHDLYDAIAQHFSGTRHQPWPAVERFIHSLPAKCKMADVGCGNGKYLAVRNDITAVGCDISSKLVDICVSKGFNAVVGDTLRIPFESNAFDGVLSIAVLHHISTEKRRLSALTELVRLLVPGSGQLLVTVWSREQEGGFSIENKDVWVPWKVPEHVVDIIRKQAPTDSESTFGAPSTKCGKSERCAQTTSTDKGSGLVVNPGSESAEEKEKNSSKQMLTFQRYCHLYERGELEALLLRIPGVSIVHSYFDKGNWAVIVKKS